MKKNIAEYQLNQLTHAPAIQRLTLLIQKAIHYCDERNSVQLNKAIRILDKSLNHAAWPELANNLHKLNQHLLACCEQQKFAQAKDILQKLKQAWLATSSKI